MLENGSHPQDPSTSLVVDVVCVSFIDRQAGTTIIGTATFHPQILPPKYNPPSYCAERTGRLRTRTPSRAPPRGQRIFSLFTLRYGWIML